MKKNILLSIFLVTTTLSFGQISGSIHFSSNDFHMRDTLGGNNATYTYFSANPYENVETPGLPCLPIRYERFILPYGMEIDSIVVSATGSESFSLDHAIYPAQRAVASCIGCPAPGFKNIDTSIYYSADPFPGNLAEADSYGYWHTSNIVTVKFYPYQYYPSTNKLFFNGTLQYSIFYSLPPDGSSKAPVVKMKNAKYGRFVNQLTASLVNPGDISAFLTGIEILSDGHSEAIDSAGYIVIAPGSFIESQAMKDFVLWKKKRGIDVKVISISAIYPYAQSQNWVDDIGNTSSNSNSISDNAAKLRKYLQQYYQNAGAEWILLVGDENLIPVRRFWATHGPDYADDSVITDKYFADFNSDYNVDGDGKFGEWGNMGDEVDLFPESYIGRILCSNLQEFTNWVAKLINYETNPGNGETGYLKRFNLTMADEFQQKIEQNQYIYNNLNIFSTSIYKELPFYNSPTPTAPRGDTIIARVNRNPGGWWTWSDHGSNYYFASMTDSVNRIIRSTVGTGSTSNGLLSLSNANRYGIIHSGCCSIASFGGTALCMAQEVLTAPLKGSVAISGCTDLSWIGDEYDRLKKYTTTIRNSHNGSITTTGHTGVLEWAANSVSGGELNHETYLTHNYFGDPEMMYYTKEPIRIVATVSPRHIEATQTDTLHIVVNNLATNDTVVVCLYKHADGMQIEFQRSKVIKGVPGIDTVSFIIPANTLTSKMLNVTISGFNYLPYTDEIIVSPGCGYVTNPEYITTTPYYPWSDVRFKDRDVIINPGVTLTVTGSVYFVPSAKLIVKQGGKLIIDGGKLASSCENLWKGVEVWGNSILTQYSTVNQGFIQVTNNGCINDAICAISTAKPTANGFVAGTSGGMFSCTNAKFVNNKCSIHVYPFQYQNDNYNSNISRTSFTLDDTYIGEPDGSPMVLLEGIKGLGMTGLTFTNSRPQGGALSLRGIGIKAINSGFRLTQICSNTNQQPCTEYIKPSFNGLFYGIHCLSTSAAKFVQVEHANFTGNDRGIYLSAVVNPSITQCYFKTKTGTGILPSSGLYLDHCTGYSIQENSFEGCNNGGTTFDYGIVVNSSGTVPNEIYNNLFSSLQYGIAAQDINRNPVNDVGLVCKCNDFSGNKTDQAVLISSTSNTYKGIALYQGDSLSITGLAGNTFSQRSLGSGTYDLYNQGSRFKYYHHSNTATKRLKPVPQLCTNVYLKEWIDYSYDKQTSCPSKLISGGSNLEEMKVEFQSTSNSVQQKETELQELVDGGSTEQTTENIVYSIPPEALILRDELLTKSPYLSDTVLQSAVANEYVLPNVMIRDILVANPQSASSEPVLNELDKRTEPMPEDLYNQILDTESAYSPLEIREMELASLKTKQAWLFNSIFANYLNDTTESINDSLKNLLQTEPTPEAKYQLALMQMTGNNTIAAAATIEGISSSFELSKGQQAIFNDYLSYLEILKEMNRDTLPGTETDSIQTAALLSLMSYVNEPVKSYIRNILIANRVITYEEPYLVANELKASRIRKSNQASREENTMLHISPNPATSYLLVRYDLNSQIAAATFEVVSLHGQVLLSKPLNKSCDRFVVSLSGFTPGIYIASVKVRGKTLKSIRIVVVK